MEDTIRSEENEHEQPEKAFEDEKYRKAKRALMLRRQVWSYVNSERDVIKEVLENVLENLKAEEYLKGFVKRFKGKACSCKSDSVKEFIPGIGGLTEPEVDFLIEFLLKEDRALHHEYRGDGL